MDTVDPPPIADKAPPRLGGAIQIGVVALVLTVMLVAILVGGREAPDIVRAGGPFADSFDIDGPLAATWELPAGEIVAASGAAMVATTSPEGTAFAVRRHGLRARRTSAVLAGGGEGAGLLLGYRDSSDYWAVVASPAAGAWLIVHVQEGAVRERFTTVPAPTAPGTRIEVTVDDRDMRVSIAGGAEALAQAQERLVPADGLVLLAGGDSAARWDEFEVGAP